MSNVVNGRFPTHRKIPKQESPASVAPVAAIEAPTPATEEVVETPMKPVYVRLHSQVFNEMLNALNFYAVQGFDHGKQARDVLQKVFAKEPA